MISSLPSFLRRAGLLAACLLVLAPSFAAAQPQFTITTPRTYGDQLFFFYDARADRVPFLTVSNLADTPIEVAIDYYSQDLKKRLARQPATLSAMGHIIVDPNQVIGVRGTAGLAVVTPVAGTPAVPVVPPAQVDTPGVPPLFGSFTLANTKLGAGFGQNPFARIAEGPSGRPAAGTPIDGTNAFYELIAPSRLVVPSYFDLAQLAPASADGNRVLLASFEDDYTGGGWDLVPVPAVMDATFLDASGKSVASTIMSVDGVRLDDLQSIAGTTTLEGSGKLLLTVLPQPIPTNLFGLFSQTLGTFSIGQRMPGYEVITVI